MTEHPVNKVAVVAFATIGPLVMLVLPLLLLVGFGLTVVAILASTVVVVAVGALTALGLVLARRAAPAPRRDPWVSAFSLIPVVARVEHYQGTCPLERCQPGREFGLTAQGAGELCPAACSALEGMVQRCRQGDDVEPERPVFRSRICEVTFRVYPVPEPQTAAA